MRDKRPDSDLSGLDGGTARVRRALERRSPSGSSRAREYFARERRALLRRLADDLLDREPAQMAVCDVGCGSGSDLAYWRDLGVEEARLAGTELLADRASAAGCALPAADIRLVDGYELPFDSNRFSLTTAALVFTLIESAEDRHRLFREMWRITEPGGAVAIYDFRVRKPTNRDVIALTASRVLALSGRHPDAAWSAGPFLPALPLALAMPRPLRTLLLRALPRTHVLYAWLKGSRLPPAATTPLHEYR